jgi:hypothetical protein
MSSNVESNPGTLTASASAVLAIGADAAFGAITDLAHLPDWNERMTRVVECPERLEPGAQWVVEFAVFGRRWRSRSQIDVVDTAARRFEYRTRTDDGNTSFADWRWRVEPLGEGCRVTAGWDLHPQTFWRRVLFGRVRARQLARTELPASLAALAGAAEERST